MNKKALLVVDLQNDFLEGGALAVNNSNAIVPIINQIQDKFDLVVASQDWHPQGHESFASAHPGKKLFDKIDLHGITQVLWPDHCVQNTKGAEFSSLWQSEKASCIFRKGTLSSVDSYSAFFDNDHLNTSGLLGYLKEQQVSELYLCGLAAEFCVFYSAKDAVRNGIKTFFLDFATAPINKQALEQAHKELHDLGVVIVKQISDLDALGVAKKSKG